MERIPEGAVRKSARIRALRRDSQELIAQMDAYTVQYKDALLQLYSDEPDQGYWPGITDREAELWGPLLIHAKLAGPVVEQRLLKVAQNFGQRKDEIDAQDSYIAKAVDVLEAIKSLEGETFTGGQVAGKLGDSEAWAYTFARIKGLNDVKQRAAKVGYFLSNFRLKKLRHSKTATNTRDKWP
jgi:hypothetical protein